MNNQEYIKYLNSLHNYHAKNQNAYGEENVKNPFFKEIMVNTGLSTFILESIEKNPSHIIILTGHAGDGKTSVMYQTLREAGVDFQPQEKIHDYYLPSGKQCRCIKDFSEITDEQKKNVLKEAIDITKKGNYVFMVANTGPLINTFGELFQNSKKSEEAKIELINLMDHNTGKISNIMGYDLSVINVARLDNTFFAVEFLEKMLQEKLWMKCEECTKKGYCHILRNRNLILQNKKQVNEFLNMHFIWITSYGKRLTIRSMTEQLAYMITGGRECNDVKDVRKDIFLFSNLFFGYLGTKKDLNACNILAIREAQDWGYDQKRMRFDENLLVSKEYQQLFGKEVVSIIQETEKKNEGVDGWNEFLRRIYFFMNIETSEQNIQYAYEDIFSKKFRDFLALRNGEKKPSRNDNKLICSALSMIYTGIINEQGIIPITLSRNSGITQNVQLVIGILMEREIKIKLQETEDGLFFDKNKKYILKLGIGRNELKSEITLPLLNYFEEIKDGIISTNVDPQLSHGIESLKAELADLLEKEDNFEMVILKNKSLDLVELEWTEDNKIREV